MFCKRKSIAVLIVCLVIIGLASCATPKRNDNDGPITKDDPRSYFPLKEGNEWTYESESTRKLKGSQPQTAGREIVFKVTGKAKAGTVDCLLYDGFYRGRQFQREFYELSREGLIAHKRIVYTAAGPIESMMEPPEMMLKFPLDKYPEWKWKGTLTKKAGEDKKQTITGQFDFKVTREEEVEVPAGKFNAVKVETTGATSNGDKLTARRWFAKGVGVIKEISYVEFDVEQQERKNIGKRDKMPVIESFMIKGELKSYKVGGEAYPKDANNPATDGNESE